MEAGLPPRPSPVKSTSPCIDRPAHGQERTYDDKMKLDIPFGEALEQFAGTNPKEMHANIERAKKKKPPGGKKRKPSLHAHYPELVIEPRPARGGRAR